MENEENYINISGYLHDGHEIHINCDLLKEHIKDSDIVRGGQITYHLDFPCPGCRGTYAYLWLDGDHWIAFCGENPCLKAQSLASRIKDKSFM